MKKICTLLCLMLAAFVLSSCTQRRPVVIATIDDEDVTADERFYYENIILAESSPEELTGKYEDITPADVVETKALEYCFNAKMTLIVCRENKIFSDIDFFSLKKAAKKDGSVSQECFYSDYVEQGREQLKATFSDTILKPGETEIETYGFEKAVDEKLNEYILERIAQAEIVHY